MRTAGCHAHACRGHAVWLHGLLCLRRADSKSVASTRKACWRDRRPLTLTLSQRERGPSILSQSRRPDRDRASRFAYAQEGPTPHVSKMPDRDPAYRTCPRTIRQHRWILLLRKSSGTVWRLISWILAAWIAASSNLKRRKFVEKKTLPPGVINSGEFRGHAPILAHWARFGRFPVWPG